MTQPYVQRQTRWRKSSRSQEHGACVELARLHEAVAVRDSMDPHGPVLSFPQTDWRAFIERLKTTDSAF